MSRRTALLLAGVALLALVFLFVGYRSGGEPAPSETTAGRVAVETRPAERRSIADIREFSGTLEASATLLAVLRAWSACVALAGAWGWGWGLGCM